MSSCNIPLFSLLIMSLVNKCLFFSTDPQGSALISHFWRKSLKSQCVLFVIIAVDFVAIRFVLAIVVPVWLHYYLSINTLSDKIIFNYIK